MNNTPKTYFFTGFPGFIASSLIKQMIQENYAIEKIHLLVLPHQIDLAKTTITEIIAELGTSSNLFNIIEGDITQANLAMDDSTQLQLKDSVNYVYHLAAIYDLAVPKDIAYKVNVIGTGFVNDWVQTLTNLDRYVYFSTCYVAGKRAGKILESELDMGQAFKNHYESTKYEAEVLVKKIIDKIPSTIIRPGIVVGHSKTGHTLKFDGPYFFFNLFRRFKAMPLTIPYFGKGNAPANFVPVDFIFDATLYLAHSEKGIGQTYQLANPKPNTIRETFEMLYSAYFNSKPKYTIPLSMAYFGLSIGPLRRWLRVEREVLDYFTLMADYDSTNTQRDLEGSGIHCPEFKELAPVMAAYYQQHINSDAKQIKVH